MTKFSCSIEIELSRAAVVELMIDPKNFARWQPGFVEMRHVEGEPGRDGARSELDYEMSGKRVVLVETIERADLPAEISLSYEGDGMVNKVKNRFVELEPELTLWTSDNEFRCSGLMMRVMAFLAPGALRRETQKHQRLFKEFAEAEGKRRESRYSQAPLKREPSSPSQSASEA